MIYEMSGDLQWIFNGNSQSIQPDVIIVQIIQSIRIVFVKTSRSASVDQHS